MFDLLCPHGALQLELHVCFFSSVLREQLSTCPEEGHTVTITKNTPNWVWFYVHLTKLLSNVTPTVPNKSCCYLYHCIICVCVPGCLKSCMRTTETLCRCSTAAPNWSTGSRPTARSLPGLNTPKTSCRRCHATTVMLSQVCGTDAYKCIICLLFTHTYWAAPSLNSTIILSYYFDPSFFSSLRSWIQFVLKWNSDNKPHLIPKDIRN